MKNLVSLFLIVAALCLATCSTCRAENLDVEEDNKNNNNNNNNSIQISAKCASVITVAGTALGAGAAFALTPAALCAAGFCSTGVAGGSFASWWQSTMPLIAAGGLFAQLQALAMGGAGMTTITVTGGVLGGAAGVTFLSDFCTFVDETDPDSGMGIAFHASMKVVIAAIETKESLETQCASSETCAAVTEAVAKAVTATVKSTSSMWNSFTTGVSKAATRVQHEWETIQLEVAERLAAAEAAVEAAAEAAVEAEAEAEAEAKRSKANIEEL
jgi:hypothetical protein